MDAFSLRRRTALDGRPRLLDLFCGAGAVSIGYAQAGWDVVGVEIDPKVIRRYPFPRLCADALSVGDLLDHFDAVHASPPCLRDTSMRHAKGAKGLAHPDLITPTLAMLRAWGERTGKPWVVENVPEADLGPEFVMLNGFMFGLGATTADGTRFHLERERKFATNWPLEAPPWARSEPIIGVYGGHVRNRSAAHGGRRTADFPGEDKPRLMREAMGIGAEWGQTMAEMSQAVPPAYTRHIGEQMLDWIEGGAGYPRQQAARPLAPPTRMRDALGLDATRGPEPQAATSLQV